MPRHHLHAATTTTTSASRATSTVARPGTVGIITASAAAPASDACLPAATSGSPLHLIGEKPRHGYQIIKAIEEQVGGAYSPGPGVIYPTLTLLEEVVHVTVTPGDGGRKLHTITVDGRAYLDAYRPALDAPLARLEDAHERHGGGVAPQILRARENLRLALRMRLARGPLTTAQINAVASAIDLPRSWWIPSVLPF
jgi:DNA-binding PadR family transcriptional regulator